MYPILNNTFVYNNINTHIYKDPIEFQLKTKMKSILQTRRGYLKQAMM